jgi:hypothetical protein
MILVATVCLAPSAFLQGRWNHERHEDHEEGSWDVGNCV